MGAGGRDWTPQDYEKHAGQARKQNVGGSQDLLPCGAFADMMPDPACVTRGIPPAWLKSCNAALISSALPAVTQWHYCHRPGVSNFLLNICLASGLCMSARVAGGSSVVSLCPHAEGREEVAGVHPRG